MHHLWVTSHGSLQVSQLIIQKYVKLTKVKIEALIIFIVSYSQKTYQLLKVLKLFYDFLRIWNPSWPDIPDLP